MPAPTLNIGFNKGPATLQASHGQFGILKPQAVLTEVGSPPTGQVKSHSGNYWYGTAIGGGPGVNNSDMTAFAGAFPLLKGYCPNYVWSDIESVLGNYGNNGYAGQTANFQMIIDDFNYLQNAAPGARFVITIDPETFGDYTSGGTSQTVNGNGVPDYILSGSTYGPAGNNGTQYGYQLQIEGGDINAITAAIWRPAVANRLAALFVALAGTSFTTTAGPYTGQTFTFDTHPLIEGFITGIDVFAGPYNDYSSTYFLSTANSNIYPTVIAAVPHTPFAFLLDYLGGDTGGQMVTAIAQMYAARVALTWPDTYGTERVENSQLIYSGGSWNGSAYVPGGGINYSTLMDCFGNVQRPDYGKSGAGYESPAQIMANNVSLNVPRCMWYMGAQNAPYSSYSGYAFYQQYIQSLATANPNLNAVCPAAYVAVGGCNST